MNRSIKSLILAAGIAVAGVTLTVPAHADGIPSGPGTLGGVQQGPIVDPKPQPKPVPAGPGDIVNPPQCTHGCGDDQGPQGPKDLAPAPDEEVTNGGPLEPLDPEDDPANNAPLDQGCFTGCDVPDEPTAGQTKPTTPPSTEVAPALLDLDRKFGADSSEPVAAAAPVAEDGGPDAGWLLAGSAGLGSVLVGLILAAVARRRRQQAAAA